MKWLVRETPIYLLCITYGFPMFFFAHFRNGGSENVFSEKKLCVNRSQYPLY